MSHFLPYDIEVYPNIFTCVIYSPEHDAYATFEVSERKNQINEFCELLIELGRNNDRMVGFNNFGYDYPVIHHLFNLWKTNRDLDWKEVTRAAKEKSQTIIDTSFDNRFTNIIWSNEQVVQQVDLMKIHHFDNAARATSLKAIEFNNRSKNIGDLPYDPNQDVPLEGFDELVKYNKHDVTETYRFYVASKGAFELRRTLGRKYGRDFTNHNDTKIGKEIFVMALEKEGVDCYEKVEGKKTLRQTTRESITLGDVMFDYLDFQQKEFVAIFKWFKNQTIRETKGVFSEVNFEECLRFLPYADCTRKKGKLAKVNIVVGGEYRDVTLLKTRKYMCPIVGGLKYVFGTGGLHASVESSSWHADDEYTIVDVDVTSYYPWLAIANKIYPEHLGEKFCEVYEHLFDERSNYEKGTAENLSLKLALNGVYGDSNSKYSPFFDSKYTMGVTVNGQLSLCMLAEQFMGIDNLQILQVNTDGITVRLKRSDVSKLEKSCSEWEKMTGLTLEHATYKSMFIKNVNNYLAVYENGEVKRKGKYEYDVGWHQNHSQKVVAKAVEAHLVEGKNIREFIENHEDLYDFYMMCKCDRKSSIVFRDGDGNDTPLQRVNRYYASTEGGSLIKIMPPLKKKITKKLLADFKRLGATFENEDLEFISKKLLNIEEFDIEELKNQGFDSAQIAAFELCQPKDREIGITKESLVTVHNKLRKMKNINYNYYIDEAQKLVEELNHTT